MSNPGISAPQKLVEVFKVSEKSNNIFEKISPEPITEFQLKLIVWEAEDMAFLDF